MEVYPSGRRGSSEDAGCESSPGIHLPAQAFMESACRLGRGGEERPVQVQLIPGD